MGTVDCLLHPSWLGLGGGKKERAMSKDLYIPPHHCPVGRWAWHFGPYFLKPRLLLHDPHKPHSTPFPSLPFPSFLFSSSFSFSFFLFGNPTDKNTISIFILKLEENEFRINFLYLKSKRVLCFEQFHIYVMLKNSIWNVIENKKFFFYFI